MINYGKTKGLLVVMLKTNNNNDNRNTLDGMGVMPY